MKTIAIAVLATLALSGPVWAEGGKTTTPTPQPTTANAGAIAGAAAGAVSGSVSGASIGDVLVSGTVGGSSANVGNVSGGPSSASASGGSARATNGDQITTITEQAPEFKDWVPNPYAPNLTTGDCMGSWSGGASGSGFGISFGKTRTDKECQTRRNSILLHQLGHTGIATEVMCGITEIKEADDRTGGTLCADNVQGEQQATQQREQPQSIALRNS